MSKIFFMGDTHFNHKNIIEYTSRTKYFEPKDIESMEKEIIKRWNETVGPNDIVYHVGDFSFGDQEEVKRLVNKLNGKIRLVLGNHDHRKKPHWYNNLGFDMVSQFPIILEDWYIISHEPIKYLSTKMPYINIHGHTHDEEYANSQRVNVCWEVIDGYPISFDSIKKRFKELNEYTKATLNYVQGKETINAAMNFNEGYVQGFIDGSKKK